MSVIGIDLGNDTAILAQAKRGGVDVLLNENSTRLNQCVCVCVRLCQVSLFAACVWFPAFSTPFSAPFPVIFRFFGSVWRGGAVGAGERAQ